MINFKFSAYSMLIVAFLSCDKSLPDLSTGKDLVLTAEEQTLVSRSNEFAFRIFNESVKQLEQDQNAMISPLSIQAALSMTLQGAKGPTREAMLEAIGLQGLHQQLINTYFKKLISDLPELDPQTKLAIANSIWHRQQFEVLPVFLDVNRQFYKAEVNALDFAAAQSLQRINGWVNDNTQGKIDKIVDQLPDDLVMLLINAVYFRGSWEHRFDESLTREDDFYPETTSPEHAGVSLRAEYMFAEHTYNYARYDSFELLELPYGNKKYSMLLLLPGAGQKVRDVMQAIGQGQTALTNPGLLTPRKLKLYLPKFKFSYKQKLNEALTNLGMGLAFSDHADFTGINANGGLTISEVNHKSFIEVNEEGTEAAAVTSVGIVLTSAGPQAPVFKADRPFLFAIRETTSGLIVFLGQVNNPNL